MDEVISFELLPTFEECYIVDNLKISKHLVNFTGEKKIDGVTYELNVYKNIVDIYTNKSGGNTFKTLCHIIQDGKVHEVVANDLQSIFKLFKSEMREYSERKKKWEQKSKINISV